MYKRQPERQFRNYFKIADSKEGMAGEKDVYKRQHQRMHGEKAAEQVPETVKPQDAVTKDRTREPAVE